MKSRALCLVVVGCLAVWPCTAAGLDPPVSSADDQRPPFARYDAFRYLLGDNPNALDLQPLSDVLQFQHDPKDTLLIAFGDVSVLGNHAQAVDQFLFMGGAILLATDQKTPQGLDNVLGRGVTGEHLQAVRPSDSYRSRQECPLIRKFERHAIFDGIRVIATNVPSALTKPNGDTPYRSRIVATFPPTSGQPSWMRPAFAAVYQGRRGDNIPEARLLVLSDQSVFINGMMLQTDNNNFDFAYNCLHWLTGPGRRKKVLFLDDGNPVTNFEVNLRWTPGRPPPLPNLPAPPVAVINQAISDLEDENIFHRLFFSVISPQRFISGLAVGLTVMLLGYGFVRLLGQRHRIESGAPLFDPLLQRLAPAGAVMEQRHEAMLKAGNLYEAARDLARHCFEPPHQPAPAANGPLLGPQIRTMVMPRIVVRGGWWQRWILQHQVRRLWRLAYGHPLKRVSLREFNRLGAWCKKIHQALADGTLRLEEPTE